MIKLIRYANEGFYGHEYYSEDEYTPKLVNEKDMRVELFITGCFVFVEEVDPDALIMFGKDRSLEKRNEIHVPDDTLIWTCNIYPKVNGNGNLDRYGTTKYREIEGMLNWNSWIKLTAYEIAERVRLVKKHDGKVCYLYSEGIYEC